MASSSKDPTFFPNLTLLKSLCREGCRKVIVVFTNTDPDVALEQMRKEGAKHAEQGKVREIGGQAVVFDQLTTNGDVIDVFRLAPKCDQIATPN